MILLDKVKYLRDRLSSVQTNDEIKDCLEELDLIIQLYPDLKDSSLAEELILDAMADAEESLNEVLN